MGGANPRGMAEEGQEQQHLRKWPKEARRVEEGRALAKLNYIREGARKRAEKLAIVTPRCEKEAVEGEEAVFGNKVLQKKKTFPCASFTFSPNPSWQRRRSHGTPPKKETALMNKPNEQRQQRQLLPNTLFSWKSTGKEP